MGYAVELFLKDEEAKAIRRLFSTTRSVLADIGATPHVSLAVFEDVDVPKLTGIVRTFAARTAPFKIRLSSIGIFPGQANVVFLAPVVTENLLKAHASIQEQLAAEGLSCHPYYSTDLWVPHCAVTMEEPLSRSFDTIKAIQDSNVLGEYTIDNVNVVKFRPVVTLSSFYFAGEDTEPSV